jgi:glycosyltransferase involved in cell wall biosynthesis
MGAAMSIVVTVFNDRVGLAELLPALAAQRRPPEEIVIVDAGSTDGSLELLDYWRERGLPLRLMDVPGAGISAGRNRGIAGAEHDRIAVTDAGCRPAPGWLAALARGLERCDFVAGTYTVDHATPFEHAVAVTLYPDVSELYRELRLPTRAWQLLFGRRFRIDRATGRSMAFRRSCWENAGGFPENVGWGEDVTFSAAAVYADAYAVLAADAVVAWRGRGTWRENALMYWRYAEGEAMLAVQPRALARGLVWTLAGVLGIGGGRRGRLAVAAGAGVYASLPIVRAHRTGLAIRHWWRILAVLAMKDLAMLGGTAAGVGLRRRPADTQPVPARQAERRRPTAV